MTEPVPCVDCGEPTPRPETLAGLLCVSCGESLLRQETPPRPSLRERAAEVVDAILRLNRPIGVLAKSWRELAEDEVEKGLTKAVEEARHTR